MSDADQTPGSEPAFPEPFQGHCEKEGHFGNCGCYLRPGITIRDYFAAIALPVLLDKEPIHHSMEKIAEKAYAMADKMIAARQSKARSE